MIGVLQRVFYEDAEKNNVVFDGVSSNLKQGEKSSIDQGESRSSRISQQSSTHFQIQRTIISLPVPAGRPLNKSPLRHSALPRRLL